MGTDLEYTFVVTGPYTYSGRELYLAAVPVKEEDRGTFDIRRKRPVLLGDGEGSISLTTMQDVGKFVVAALKYPQAAKNRALHVNSFTTTPREILNEFEKQTGGGKWDISFTSLEKMRSLEQQARARGDAKTETFTLRRIWTEGKTLHDPRDNGLIGMESDVDSLADAIRQAIKVQSESW